MYFDNVLVQIYRGKFLECKQHRTNGRGFSPLPDFLKGGMRDCLTGYQTYQRHRQCHQLGVVRRMGNRIGKHLGRVHELALYLRV